ncbi:hypothetical protein NTE_03229 [Candidatus Nitrososphaera evergladensis SR1]|uniref:Uncharacterized protein n=1 Tax=Candidatus Nitrososphaera evergladensis SR1 TaxID=1459636 RepID=A0A075MVT7_9ARCH|nr:hypothetical protein NTE_03229 [Candidatus Nitrososphaera evergladensis SR1]
MFFSTKERKDSRKICKVCKTKIIPWINGGTKKLVALSAGAFIASALFLWISVNLYSYYVYDYADYQKNASLDPPFFGGRIHFFDTVYPYVVFVGASSAGLAAIGIISLLLMRRYRHRMNNLWLLLSISSILLVSFFALLYYANLSPIILNPFSV